MPKPLTLMAVHAHPDDESVSTGGVLARSAAEGIRTVVVTCTNGELGDAPGGIKPGDEGHDEALVVRIRQGELEAACKVLGVGHLERLGYRDSGMVDWDYQQRPDAFCNVPVEAAAGRLCELFEAYAPDVVITYEEASGYDHPDHVQTARVTLAALEQCDGAKKVYLTAMSLRSWERVRRLLEERRVELPPMPVPSDEMLRRMEATQARITTSVELGPFVEQKRAAVAVHASQFQESFFSLLPPEVFPIAFGEEHFIRVHDTTGADLPETDLFAGLH